MIGLVCMISSGAADLTPLVRTLSSTTEPRSTAAPTGGPVRVLVVLVVVFRSSRAVDLGVGVMPARCELPLEGVVVGVGAEVLQLPRHLGLLGLLTAAPHGVDPLIRRSGASANGGAPDFGHPSLVQVTVQ